MLRCPRLMTKTSKGLHRTDLKQYFMHMCVCVCVCVRRTMCKPFNSVQTSILCKCCKVFDWTNDAWDLGKMEKTLKPTHPYVYYVSSVLISYFGFSQLICHFLFKAIYGKQVRFWETVSCELDQTPVNLISFSYNSLKLTTVYFGSRWKKVWFWKGSVFLIIIWVELI